MRFVCLMLLVSLCLRSQQLRIDHVTVAGQDLQAMMSHLADIGLHCEYGGPHRDHVTQMALTSFPDGSYLELIAPQKGADPKAIAAHVWSKRMIEDAGPCAWAIRSSNLAADAKDLQAHGLNIKTPVQSGRARPDGKPLEWEIMQIGEEPRGTFFPFVIQDLTPRQERVFLTGKPTTKDFGGVSRVVIAVRDLRASADRYREAFELPAPIEEVDAGFGAHLAIFTGTPVVLAAPLLADSWIATRLGEIGEGPCAFILKGRKTAHFQVTEKSHWSMADISWLDENKLKWHLGFE